jgi:hypothetical protein
MTGVGVQEESSETERRAASELIPGRLEPKVERTKKSHPTRSVSDPDILLTSLVMYDEPDERRA